jgi:hypothetical protein
MSAYRVSRKDYNEIHSQFLSTVCLRAACVSGCKNFDIELRIQDRASRMTRSEAVELYRALSRKLICQEYLQGLSSDQIVEDSIPAADGSVDAHQDA